MKRDWKEDKGFHGRPYGTYILYVNKKTKDELVIQEVENMISRSGVEGFLISITYGGSAEEGRDVHYLHDYRKISTALKFAKKYMMFH